MSDTKGDANVDLTIDLRDAVGDRLHLSDDFVKDGVGLAFGGADGRLPLRLDERLPPSKLPYDGADPRLQPTNPSASEIINSARRKTPSQKRSFSGIQRFFTRKPRKQHSAYRSTRDKVDNGPACRIYGSVKVKKVTANLHITTLGHGYMSYEHTDHQYMNLSHIVHEFSFGPFFPAISQPLDLTFERTEQREWGV